MLEFGEVISVEAQNVRKTLTSGRVISMISDDRDRKDIAQIARAASFRGLCT